MKLVKEYALSMDMTLVKSNQIKADWLTRVPQRWIDAIMRNADPVEPACTETVRSVGSNQIRTVHRQSSHLKKQIDPPVSKATVRTIVKECEERQSIDPSPVHWPEDVLKIAMEITQGTHCFGINQLQPHSVYHLAMPPLVGSSKCDQPIESIAL